MARPKSKNPRRERRVTYLAENEARELDRILEIRFPQFETASDRMREALLDWLGAQDPKGGKIEGGTNPGALEALKLGRAKRTRPEA